MKHLVLRSNIVHGNKLFSPSGQGFEWVNEGEIICNEYNPAATFKDGLFGLLYGAGAYANLFIGGYHPLVFQVLEVNHDDICILPNQVKFRKGNVVYTGNLPGAILKLKGKLFIETFYKLVYISIQLDRFSEAYQKDIYTELFSVFKLDPSVLDYLTIHSDSNEGADGLREFCNNQPDFIERKVNEGIHELLRLDDHSSFKQLLSIAFHSLYKLGFNPENFSHTEKSFINHSPLHGVNHTYRVMINSLLLSVLMQVNLYDAQSTFLAAYLHDLGRVNDGYCTNHGQYCIDSKYQAYSLLIKSYNVNPWYEGMIKEAIVYHCKPDHMAPGSIVLSLLKDSDCLDRCRLGDLDKRYLRHPETGYLIQFSEWLYKNSPTEILTLREFVNKILS